MKSKINTFLLEFKLHIKKYPLCSLLLFLAFSLWTSIILFGSKFYRDETYHYAQIKNFWKGKFYIIEMLTTIPGYHAVIAFISKISPFMSVMQSRIISFPFSLLALFVFYSIIKKDLPTKDALRKTLLFAFLPISFIYFPLLYTDLFSTLLVLTAFYFAMREKFHFAALASIASILSRQNNIVWHVFIWTYSYLLLNGFSFSVEVMKQFLKKTYGFPLGIAAFGFFILINGGIAVGDKSSHQAGIYLGNIYFFLAICGILFWPLLAANLSKKYFYSPKFIIGLIIGAFISGIFLIHPPLLHGYNGDTRFLRNIILIAVYKNYAFSLVYAFTIFIGYLSLSSIKLKKYMFLIYPFILLYLAPSWLIEQRYSIVPLVFILLSMRKNNEKEDWLTISYFAILSILLFCMIIFTKLFF